MKRSLVLAALAALAAAACMDSPTAPRALAPSMSVSAQAQGRYIVRFRDTESDPHGQANRLIRAHRGRLDYTYGSAIKGFAGAFTSQDLAALSKDPAVISVEPDQIAHATSTQPNPPSWGLDRVDQVALPLNSSYSYNATGSGVKVYIIDTGIRFTHTQFGGRAITGIDEITPGGNASDCNGHGTHVSGTVGGTTYGIAKNVTLIAVRVLDCSGSGSYAQVIAGVDWVTQQKQASPSTPMAANMSLGGPFSSALNAAVTNSINAGVTYAIAAGNSNANACNESPSSTPAAITVASTQINDARSSFSNFGTCVDLFAPGSGILSSWNGSDTDTLTISGTSMATPHVAGAAALYLSLNPGATPAAVASAITGNASLNKVTSPGTGSPNRLLYTGFIGGAPPPQPPVANFSFTCNGLTCSFDASATTAQPNATYSWHYGDDQNESGKLVTHTFPAGGTFYARLTVVDAYGTSKITKNVTVTGATPAPVASFTSSCTFLACSFDASGSTAQANATYGWSWGDGTASGAGKTATHTYAAGGTFTVTLTVSDAGGSNSTSHQVTVSPQPPPAPVASFTFNCTYLNCSFDGSGSTAQPTATYAWAWGDGTANGAGKTATHGFGAGGTFTVTLTVTDAGGNNSTSQQVTVAPQPPAPVASFTSSCTFLNCSFDGSGSTAQPGATFGWSWGDGTPNGSGTTATHGYGAGGTFTVTLTVTDAGGSNSTSQQVTVAPQPPPPPSASFTVSCTFLTCGVDASGSTAQPNATYGWSWGDGTANGSGRTASHAYASGGSYTITLTVTDAGGSSSASQPVTVAPQPPPPPVANFTFSCSQLNCSFNGGTSTAQANATYGWDWGDGTASGAGKTATHSFANAGTRNVTLTVTDAGGTSTRTRAVTVNVIPIANFTFSCTGRTCTFDGSSTTALANATYSWHFGDDLNETGKITTHTFANAGTFYARLTVVDAGGTGKITKNVTVQ